MTQFFAKKLNKKGFTLAELLIVVAIIAVLVAIAIPVFTGSLRRARYGVHEANARSLKMMGVSAVLSSADFVNNTSTAKGWYIKATYDFDAGKFQSNGAEVKAQDTSASGSAAKSGLYMVIGSDETQFTDANLNTIGEQKTTGTATYVVYFVPEDIVNLTVS